MDRDGKQEIQTASGTAEALPMIGALAACSHALQGMDGKQGYFFIFNELSIRLEGVYRLKFALMNIAWFVNTQRDGRLIRVRRTKDCIPNGSERPILAEIESAPFRAFSAKKFPGMLGTHLGTANISFA